RPRPTSAASSAWTAAWKPSASTSRRPTEMALGEAFRLDEALRTLDAVPLAKVSGRLVRVSGLLLESLGCRRMTGQRCLVEQADGSLLEAQVVGFDRDITYLMPFKK